MSDQLLFVCQAHQTAIRNRIYCDRIYRDRVLRDRVLRGWFGRRPAPAPPAPLAGSAQAAALR